MLISGICLCCAGKSSETEVTAPVNAPPEKPPSDNAAIKEETCISPSPRLIKDRNIKTNMPV